MNLLLVVLRGNLVGCLGPEAGKNVVNSTDCTISGIKGMPDRQSSGVLLVDLSPILVGTI